MSSKPKQALDCDGLDCEGSIENIIRKQAILHYVLKVTSDTLDLIKSDSDSLLNSLAGFIYNNLGIISTLTQSKYRVLDNIQVLFEENSKQITNNDLDKLEMKMYGLDRNYNYNIETIQCFIKDHYKIQIDKSYLRPSKNNNEIVDYVISRL